MRRHGDSLYGAAAEAMSRLSSEQRKDVTRSVARGEAVSDRASAHAGRDYARYKSALAERQLKRFSSTRMVPAAALALLTAVVGVRGIAAGAPDRWPLSALVLLWLSPFIVRLHWIRVRTTAGRAEEANADLLA